MCGEWLENNPIITSSKVNVPLNLITLAEEEKLNEEVDELKRWEEIGKVSLQDSQTSR